MITDRVSMTKTKPIIGKTKTESVIMAITPSVAPREIAPVSPIMNLAGMILNQRKPIIDPAITVQKADRINRPLK